MKSTRYSFLFNSALTLTLLGAAAGLMFSQSGGQPQQKGDQPQAKSFAKQKAPERPGSVEKISVHGKSLEGNLEGDSPDRDVFVYLPLSYAKNRNQRYPVVYFLHGYGLGAEAYMNALWASDAADRDAASGSAKEMIVVFPDSYTRYDGSMYSNSPTTGNWETFLTEDLVSYIDSHYRTIASRESRGLAGHSMGGYGTLRLAMKYPELYAAIYPMSSCCLMNNPFATGRGPAPAPKQGDAKAKGGRGGGFANVGFAQAAAWAPNPMNPPQFFDLPTKDGQVVPSVAAKYLANSPLAMVDQYSSNLKKYKAFMMDCGLQDTLQGSNKELDESLTRLGVPHNYETYEGDHTNHVKDRWELKVLPFFANNLAFTQSKKK
ncbi:MAG TPA: alpha/beta fold hydrolase [Bryobacteraceae bacterium]|jgi:enterochelin esterase-like enzyme|nr:alpha/beta fold hydrolase [Bryobacteraceae bacterium]